MYRVCVIGAGSMGTAIALALQRSGNEVSILTTKFDTPFVEAINRDRLHPTINQYVPEAIELVEPGGWSSKLQESSIVFVAVASSGVRSVVEEAETHLSDGAVWAIASKGWDPNTAKPLSTTVREVSPSRPIVVVTGPSLAAELAGGTPTAMVCASESVESARSVGDALRSPSVGIYFTDDVAGVEVGAALKNVLAIAIGMCDGISEATQRPMTNTKAALFSRGLIEMSRLAIALGGRGETVLGLAGAGDLFVTVLGGRNGRFGRLVGMGVEPARALEEMNTTVEGYENTKEALALSASLGVELPVATMVHSVLFERVPPEKAIAALLQRPVEAEI